MFQLIISVIAIALIAALAIASIFYAGEAFTSASTRTNVATLMTQSQQIVAGVAVYKTTAGVELVKDNTWTERIPVDENNALYTERYLHKLPLGVQRLTYGPWELTLNGTVLFIPFKDGSPNAGGKLSAQEIVDICAEVYRLRGATGSYCSTSPDLPTAAAGVYPVTPDNAYEVKGFALAFN